MKLFGRKGTKVDPNKNTESPIGAQTNLSGPDLALIPAVAHTLDPNSPYTMDAEHPFGIPVLHHNPGLLAFHAFNWQERNLPGRVYPSRILRTYGRVASEVIDPVDRG